LHSIDIDDLFGDAPETIQKATSNTPKKTQPPSNNDVDMDDILPPPSPPPKSAPAKPKRGRLISNQTPLDDFHRLIDGEGDVFRKAIQDLGAVVIENVEDSFSKQAFPLAIECLKAMRETAMVYEEVETYNTYVHTKEAGRMLMGLGI
jgi:ATP-dependent DNA helicase 2 subunit 2